MGKRRRRLMSPKYARKFAGLRATVARLKAKAEPAPSPIVEEVSVVEQPVPKTTKQPVTKRKTTKKRTTTKKPTTKRSKKPPVKKDK